MVKYDAVVVHYGELWLKGRNRGIFIKRLIENIKTALDDCEPKVVDERDRLLIHFSNEKNMDKAVEKLRYIPGISWFGRVMISKNSLGQITKAANKTLTKKETVRIVANRSYKGTSFNSYEIVSEFIRKSKSINFKIDKSSKKELLINVTRNGTLISSEKINGIGGLPVGSSGKAIVLLSGGIDSPVASFYAMKRGLDVVYLHMHAFDNNKSAEESKMKNLIDVLSRYNQKKSVYYAPSYVFQSATMKVQRRHELVLFRRFLYELATEIARKEHANAIVTGESLGQVASQTIGNMTASQHGIGYIILRPLTGFDKKEIIEQAKALGTYGISIKKYKDVCSIGVSNPSTNMNAKLVSELYRDCKLDEALKRTIGLASHIG